MPKFLNLTPTGPDWPWYFRLLEIVLQIVAYPFAIMASVGRRIFDKFTEKFIA